MPYLRHNLACGALIQQRGGKALMEGTLVQHASETLPSPERARLKVRYVQGSLPCYAALRQGCNCRRCWNFGVSGYPSD